MNKGTVNANNYKKALAELQAIDPTATLPKTIKESNKDYYNVALVQRINNVEKMKYDTKVSVQPFDDRSFEKLARDYKTVGYDYILVLHNPEKPGADEKPELMVTEKNKALRDEIEAEIRAEYEAKFNKEPREVANTQNMTIVGDGETELKREVDGGTGGDGKQVAANQQEDPAKTTDISGYSIDKMKGFAEKYEIQEVIKGLTAKADILAALQTWQKES